MDFDKLGKELLKANGTEALQRAAESEAGKRLAGMIDPGEVERAARQGDAGALEAMLSKVLATPEGRKLAEQVKRAVSEDGRRS